MPASTLLTRRQIEARIAAGEALVISQNHVLRLTAWQHVHPGGRLVIQHMVGRDATDELSISHSLDTLKQMHRYRVGRVEGVWDNFTPPIQGGKFRRVSEMDDEDQTSGSSDGTASPASMACSESSSATSFDEPVKMSIASVNDKKDHHTSQAAQGWKMEVTPGSYTAKAVQAELDADLAKYPSIDAATQRSITLKFRALHQRVHDEGYYKCRYGEYGKEMIRYSALFGLFIFFLNRGWYLVSAISLGLFWQQIMFTAHDAGHRGITHNFVIDSLIGIFIGNFLSGLSVGWWKSSHNVHHFLTNDPVHDPDVQNTPLFSTSPAFFSSIKSSYYDGFHFVWDSAADFAVKYQIWTYYPIMAVARFNLYFLSWSHLMTGRSIKRGAAAWIRPTEIAAILCYFYLASLVIRSIPTWWDAAIFVFVSHLATVPLHVQITLSHWGSSTSDLGPSEAFAQRQLRTTMDVACPEWLDWIHGGLQFQAVHHLFPRVPRHNLRRLQTLVKEFCADTGIEYSIHGFVDGNSHVLSKLQQVTDQAKMLVACQAHMAATGQMGLH